MSQGSSSNNFEKIKRKDKAPKENNSEFKRKDKKKGLREARKRGKVKTAIWDT